MKAVPSRLSREDAKEYLARVEAAMDSQAGREAREAVVKALNSAVRTYSWVGIYLVKGQDLLLDAWSGPVATEHVRIPIGKGVCGFAAKAGRTEIVSDVSKDPRYLECFPTTKAEIVVPILYQNRIVGEIDVDSEELGAFSSVDREFLEAVAARMGRHCIG
jgi:GAF domain-containing protein